MTDISQKNQLYELIRANPFISQQDLALQLRLSRSAVAGHAASLIRERRLLGRAYVLPGRRPVLCLGAANLDRKLRTLAVQLKDAQRDIKGVFHTTRDGIARLPAADVRTVDVTGAGDAFAATVCWSLYQGSDDLKLACRRGLKLAAGILDEIHDFNHDFNPPPLAAPARPKLFDQD